MCSVNERSEHIVRQVRRSAHKVGDTESSEALHDLDVGCSRSYLYRRGWRRWFQLVWPRCSKQRDLQASIERCEAGTLVLWFVVVHSGGGSGADGQNNAWDAGWW